VLGIDQKKLEDILIKLNITTRKELESAKIESVRSGNDLGSTLVSMGLISKEDKIKAQAISLNIPYVDLSSTKVDIKVLKHTTKEMAKKYMAVPFGFTGDVLNVAMTNPNNVQAIEFIERRSGQRVSPYMASEDSVNRIINQYQDLSSEVAESLKGVEEEPKFKIKIEDQKLKELSEDAPVTRAVNTILEYAAKAKSSDIHIEPWENALKVRFRIDGILQEKMSLPVHIHAALISRIKILAGIKIDEHRIPQDGRFDAKVEGHEIDVRVAVSPTVNGEKAVLRLLDKSGGIIDLDSLGLRGYTLRVLKESIAKPQGMTLSTGPTGSGKSTTLYAVLSKINKPEVNIITLEDPVEYQVGGVNQIQINSGVGLTFASGLRSILRQDPDIIMVGEIRDSETAELAVQAALTGHMVLSTLHTNSAAGILPRLLDMEIEPFLIASTVSTAMAQRLVRKLCPKCRQPYKASPTLMDAIIRTVGDLLPKNEKEAKEVGYIDIPMANSKEFNLYKATGCGECNDTGYSGRIGVYEAFKITPEIERLVVKHATTSEVQDQAIKEGMITMRQDGFLKALEGNTTIEEVIAKVSEG
jgi:type IV pilus assembly protein PilB